MAGSARIKRYRCLLIALLTLCYEGLSAQEFDLYDYRYYRRFESEEELLQPEDDDSVAVAKFRPDAQFSTFALDYNLSAVRSTRRGVALFERQTTLGGVYIPFLGRGTARRLQLHIEQHNSTSDNGVMGEVALHIDSLRKRGTDVGVRFLSRNMPYSVSFSTAQLLGAGWSLTANVVARTGRDLFVEGLFGSSVSVNAVAVKEFKDRSRLAMALFVEPSMRSSRLYSTAEAFRLTGDNLYNPAWGYQDGKVRNAHIRREIVPTALATYEADISEQTKFAVTASLTAGVERYSSLDWFDAQTPAPDNYRYMPSYFADEEDIFSAVESVWLADDARYTQIDFDRLIATNRLADGEATYALSDRVERIVRSDFRGLFSSKLERGTLHYGVEATIDNRRNYKQMRDLLGASYIVDLDYFLIDDDTYGNALQNDLNAPSRHVGEGDRFGYDYAMRRYDIAAFASYRYTTDNFWVGASAKVGYTNISRRGFYRKELFADNSFGVSRHAKFSPYTLRLDGGYILNDRHIFSASIVADAKACDAEDLFLQSQYNNRLIDSPAMRRGYGGELRYIYQQPNISLSATLFAIATTDELRVQHLYDDLSGEYADVVISGIDIVRYGVEVEAEYRFADHFRTTAAICAGRYTYTDNTRISIYSDASNILLVDNVESHTRYLTLGNAPQIAATAGLSYYNRGWWAAINANYAGLRFAEPSIVMRTERILATATSPEQHSALLAQERLRDAFTVDVSLSKSLYLERFDKRIYRTKAAPRFTDKYPRARLIFRVSVRNLLGSRNMVYSAREASRLQRYKLADEYIYSRQAIRYLYAYPRTYEASVSFCF